MNTALYFISVNRTLSFCKRISCLKYADFQIALFLQKLISGEYTARSCSYNYYVIICIKHNLPLVFGVCRHKAPLFTLMIPHIRGKNQYINYILYNITSIIAKCPAKCKLPEVKKTSGSRIFGLSPFIQSENLSWKLQLFLIRKLFIKLFSFCFVNKITLGS